LAEAYDADDDSNVSTLEIDLSPVGAGDEDFSGFDMESSESSVQLKRKTRRKSFVPIVITVVILLVALAAFLFFFVTGCVSTKDAVVTPVNPAIETSESAEADATSSVVPSPVSAQDVSPPVPQSAAETRAEIRTAPREATRPAATNGIIGRKALRTEG
jgi:hypothetical protein